VAGQVWRRVASLGRRAGRVPIAVWCAGRPTGGGHAWMPDRGAGCGNLGKSRADDGIRTRLRL